MPKYVHLDDGTTLRVCRKCGNALSEDQFYHWKYAGNVCKHCHSVDKKKWYDKHLKVEPYIKVDPVTGRKIQHVEGGTKPRIYWDGNMLYMLRTYYPDSDTKDVADMCGVSLATCQRKARELGITKSKEYLESHLKRIKMLAVNSLKTNGKRKKADRR